MHRYLCTFVHSLNIELAYSTWASSGRVRQCVLSAERQCVCQYESEHAFGAEQQCMAWTTAKCGSIRGDLQLFFFCRYQVDRSSLKISDIIKVQRIEIFLSLLDKLSHQPFSVEMYTDTCLKDTIDGPRGKHKGLNTICEEHHRRIASSTVYGAHKSVDMSPNIFFYAGQIM